MSSNDTTETTHDFDQSKSSQSRKKGFLSLAAVVIIAGASYASYWHFIGSRYVSTDNAYAAAEIAAVTPAIGGIVTEVNVVDTQHVQKGDILVVINDIDAKLALQQAEADYALARRRVRSYMANDESLDALVKAREADETRSKAQLVFAEANYERAKIDLERREDLIGSGSVSGEELSNAKTAFAQAEANWNAAKATATQTMATRLSTIGNQKANATLTDNTTIDTNPEVLLAKARYDQAKINVERTIVHAPISGVVAKRQVQIGQRVQIGAPLLTIVPVNTIHIDANFKEVQLRNLKIGQTVEVTSDLYGDDVIYHGMITGLSGGTGAAFSLIPAQNATGNWIKVVQRLPVRIALDETELKNNPLQIGLSMEVKVDTDSEVNAKHLAQFQAAALKKQG
jgi:membrane fusion protein (multidrug efflux system)